ncbi:hypothetical protein ACJX0J_028465, partial [Zea mays]
MIGVLEVLDHSITLGPPFALIFAYMHRLGDFIAPNKITLTIASALLYQIRGQEKLWKMAPKYFGIHLKKIFVQIIRNKQACAQNIMTLYGIMKDVTTLKFASDIALDMPSYNTLNVGYGLFGLVRNNDELEIYALKEFSELFKKNHGRDRDGVGFIIITTTFLTPETSNNMSLILWDFHVLCALILLLASIVIFDERKRMV